MDVPVPVHIGAAVAGTVARTHARLLAVNVVPQPNALPGTNVLQTLADGIDSWALIASMVGVLVGAVLWAFGSYSQNYQQALNGRKGVIVSAFAALLIGAAPELINFFARSGATAK
jgi:hypothetical protein